MWTDYNWTLEKRLSRYTEIWRSLTDKYVIRVNLQWTCISHLEFSKSFHKLCNISNANISTLVGSPVLNGSEEMNLTFKQATNKWISCVTRRATANWVMIDYLASSILTTSTRTWVSALLFDTGFVLRTFRAHHALGSTRRWGAYIIFLTRTNCMSINLTAFTVWSTRRRYTRIARLFGFSYNMYKIYTSLVKQNSKKKCKEVINQLKL